MPAPIKYPHGWRVDLKKGGNRYRRRFSIDRYGADEKAYTAASEYIREVQTDTPPTRKKEGYELGKTIRKYNEWSERVRRKSPETMRKQVQILKVFLRFCESKVVVTLEKIDTALCLDFQDYYFRNAPFNGRRPRHDHDATATWRKYHQFVTAFLNWCARREYIERNPASHREFRIKTQEKIPNIFTSEELTLLFEYFDQQDDGRPIPLGAFFRTLLYTGMRPGEAIRLKWENVNLRTDVIQVTGQTKTKKIRSIPIHPELKKIFKALLIKGGTYLFDSGQNEPAWDDKTLYRELRRALIIMKLKPHRVYDFRHTFAANLVINGVHIGAVQELLGHARIEQTVIYIHFAPQHLKSAVEGLSF